MFVLICFTKLDIANRHLNLHTFIDQFYTVVFKINSFNTAHTAICTRINDAHIYLKLYQNHAPDVNLFQSKYHIFYMLYFILLYYIELFLIDFKIIRYHIILIYFYNNLYNHNKCLIFNCQSNKNMCVCGFERGLFHLFDISLSCRLLKKYIFFLICLFLCSLTSMDQPIIKIPMIDLKGKNHTTFSSYVIKIEIDNLLSTFPILSNIQLEYKIVFMSYLTTSSAEIMLTVKSCKQHFFYRNIFVLNPVVNINPYYVEPRCGFGDERISNKHTRQTYRITGTPKPLDLLYIIYGYNVQKTS
ncbi:hypothetical protein AGLY_006966 [Aphis glycines]|uniref:Uncharacterized protein n=1 Tax=Aphis glycines TaxID=307491 RepID=A0A6G0TPW5_APHGL|nr:hypothetical protein AGLY_006966 [Aphis glycines]